MLTEKYRKYTIPQELANPFRTAIENSDLEDLKETMPSTYNLKKSMSVQSFYDFTIHNTNEN